MLLNQTAGDIAPLLAALEQQGLGICLVHSQEEYDAAIGASPSSSPTAGGAAPSPPRLAQLCPAAGARGLVGGIIVTV
jgi:hypothetical protein